MSEKYVPFAEWLDRNRDDFMVVFTPCDAAGDGSAACRCCGSEIDCEKCDGTLHLDAHAALFAYSSARARDAAWLAAWEQEKRASSAGR